MIDEIEQCKKDINYESEDLIDVKYDKLERGWEKWGIGTKIGWLWKEEFAWYCKEFEDEIAESNDGKGFIFNDGVNPSRFNSWIRKHGFPFEGLLFTFPEQRFSITENAIVCCYDWPVEKCQSDVFWISLNRLLISPDLYKIYKL